ncbi:CCA-adding enzyme [Rhodobacteraceae bacterium THAF1]|uniref:CCA tRNA nucleotidyltransferase n=1 Tax=Palleronia sp. THAF1 TaxID=2587842 RepID=UPI000F3C9E20|nr:CCA tRNA nucleotidyltransferase [Palleronia sp. THAF1]QFU10190.1 CCA-adding enzyme [Palleronia sp. THAF1]VDC16905.1 CCA-adding enzyme [Rhodobacteraceae bacterium THAF1]
MKIDGDWRRDPDAQRLMAALADAGHSALFVGGCVRNATLGAPVADIDIATSAEPHQIIDVAKAAGFKTVPTGIDHGTVTVIGAQPLEVTTFRRDVDTDGRHATVAFTDNVADDAARRDFTMNALYAQADGTIVDPLGGWDDLQARRVRFVGDAGQRIAEDYLRILRYFRFHAWYGDASEGLDAEALAACADGAEGLERLSAERVGREMLKLLAASDPALSVAAMGQAGILARVLPGADPAGLAPLVHLEELIGVAPDGVRRLAILGGEDVADRLRLSRKEDARRVLLRDGIGSEAGLAELAWRHGTDTARDIALLRSATFSAPLPADMDARIEAGAGAVLPVTGGDFAQTAKGAEIGRKLAEAEQRWIASNFTATRDELLR